MELKTKWLDWTTALRVLDLGMSDVEKVTETVTVNEGR